MNTKALKVYDDIKHLEMLKYQLEDMRYKNITCYTATFINELLQQVNRELDGYYAIREMCKSE